METLEASLSAKDSPSTPTPPCLNHLQPSHQGKATEESPQMAPITVQEQPASETARETGMETEEPVPKSSPNDATAFQTPETANEHGVQLQAHIVDESGAETQHSKKKPESQSTISDLAANNVPRDTIDDTSAQESSTKITQSEIQEEALDNDTDKIVVQTLSNAEESTGKCSGDSSQGEVIHIDTTNGQMSNPAATQEITGEALQAQSQEHNMDDAAEHTSINGTSPAGESLSKVSEVLPQQQTLDTSVDNTNINSPPTAQEPSGKASSAQTQEVNMDVPTEAIDNSSQPTIEKSTNMASTNQTSEQVPDNSTHIPSNNILPVLVEELPSQVPSGPSQDKTAEVIADESTIKIPVVDEEICKNNPSATQLEQPTKPFDGDIGNTNQSTIEQCLQDAPIFTGEQPILDTNMQDDTMNNPLDLEESSEISEEVMREIEQEFADVKHEVPRFIASTNKGAPVTEAAKKITAHMERMRKEPKKMTRAPTPKGLKKGVKLHDHQQIALHWMKTKEKGKQGGGILADDMGLGKTLEIIALVLANKGKKPPKRPKPGLTMINNAVTLVVAPASLLDQWNKEINRFSDLKVLIYNSSTKQDISSRTLSGNDIILVSYETLLSDFSKSKKGKDTVFFDTAYRFHRVVLDEGHRIKNRKSQTSEACCTLDAVNRWYVSGTPIQNSIEELYPAFSFLKIPVYSEWDNFNQRILQQSSMVVTMRNIHNILFKYLLRRKKGDFIDGKVIVSLPKKHEIECIYAEFTDEQIDFYKAFEDDTKLKYKKYLRDSNHSIDFKKALLLRLRQVCLHPWLVNFSKGDDLHKKLLTEQHLVLNACFQFKEAQIQRILKMLEEATKAQDKVKCEHCHENEMARVIPGCGHGLCPICFKDIPFDSKLDSDNLDPGHCAICGEVYEPLHITTLIAFQCAWVEGFRLDPWDEAENTRMTEAQEEQERQQAVEALKRRLNSYEGHLKDREQVQLDPALWGDENAQKIEQVYTAEDMGSFVVEDDDLGSVDYENDSGDESGGEDEQDSAPRPKRKMDWDELDARKKARRDSEHLAQELSSENSTAVDSTEDFENLWTNNGQEINGFGPEAPSAFPEPPVSPGIHTAPETEGKQESDITGSTSKLENEVPSVPFNPGQAVTDSFLQAPSQNETNYNGDSVMVGDAEFTRKDANAVMKEDAIMEDQEDKSRAASNATLPKDITMDTQEDSTQDFVNTHEVQDVNMHDEEDHSEEDSDTYQSEDESIKDEEEDVDIQGSSGKPRMRLKLKFNARTKGREFVLPYNLLRLQALAKQKEDSRERYCQRLLGEGLPASAKLTTLISYLDRIQSEFPNDRIIIFSEWVTMLDFIEAIFYSLGKADYLRYDGSLTTNRKVGVIRQFQNVGNTKRILLCSTKAGNYGLNLTAANRIILFEPHYNPYVEDQAIDRCHRIGQTKEVFVTRIIVPETIENKILKIHERKRAQVDGAIDKKGVKLEKTGGLTDEDYDFLLGV